MPRNKGCTACPLHKTADNPCVWGEGEEGAEVMVIGEAPGRKEDQYERPFIGQSGQLIRTELGRAGLDSLYITNAVKCRPPDNRTPTAAEAKACRQYLDEEIRRIKPKYVVALGALASKTVLKKAKITEAHGQLVPMPGFTGMPVFHPAYALRDMSKLPAIKNDLQRLKRTIDGEEIGEEVKWNVVTAKTLKWFIREFQESDEFSFDVETSSLNWFDPTQTIRCLGIGLEKRSWVIPLDMPNSPYYGQLDAALPLMKILAVLARGKSAVGQNAKFDNHWLRVKFGISFYLDFDVMLAHHILDENQPHDLEYMARIELDAPEYDIPLKEKKGAHLHHEQGRHRFFEYNAKDTWYTLRLFRKFRRKLKMEKNLWKLFYWLVMPAARAMQRIEEEGLTLDLDRYAAIEKQTRAQHAEMLDQLQKLARKYNDGKDINWNAPGQVAKLLYDKIGIKCKVFTKKGAPSTGEEALLEIKDSHPVANLLVKYRELEKFIGTYLEGWKEYTVNGRLFLSYKIHGTVTGRYSSRLHQVPRDGTIRNLVIAPPGWRFAQADLSQAELRVAAEFSRDIELCNCFQPGGVDVHWRTMLHTVGTGASGEYHDLAIKTAESLRRIGAANFRISRLSLSESLELLLKAGHEAAIAVHKDWKEARKRGKSINFGFVFGMYEKKFIETCKLKYGYEPTFDEAAAFKRAYFELYPGIPRWHERQKKLVRIDGYVTNMFGRVRRLPGVFSTDKMLRMEAERQAINSPVQGTIGDWKAAALIEIDETIPHDKLRIVGEHHDALLMIVKEGCEDETLPRVRAILRSPSLLKTFKIEMVVPMDSEIEIGPWGAGKKYEDPKCISQSTN